MCHSGCVGLAVPAGVEAVAGDLARGGLEGAYTAQPCPCRLGTNALGVVSRCDEQRGGGVFADPVEAEQPRSGFGEQCDEELVELSAFGVELEDPPSQGPQRRPGRVGNRVTVSSGAHRSGALGDQETGNPL